MSYPLGFALKAEVVISCHPIVVLWLILKSAGFDFKSRNNWLLGLILDLLEGHNVCPSQWWWCHHGSSVDPGLDSQEGKWHENDFKFHVLLGLGGLVGLSNFRLK